VPFSIDIYNVVAVSSRLLEFGVVEEFPILVAKLTRLLRASAGSLKVRKALIKGKMQPLSRHQACAHGSLLYVFGGFDGKTQFNNLSYFDVDTGVWAAPLVRGDIPKPRSNHACAIVGNRMFLFGGNNQHTSGKYQVLDDFYMLDLSSFCA
jgi:hypothetical protein